MAGVYSPRRNTIILINGCTIITLVIIGTLFLHTSSILRRISFEFRDVFPTDYYFCIMMGFLFVSMCAIPLVAMHMLLYSWNTYISGEDDIIDLDQFHITSKYHEDNLARNLSEDSSTETFDQAPLQKKFEAKREMPQIGSRGPCEVVKIPPRVDTSPIRTLIKDLPLHKECKQTNEQPKPPKQEELEAQSKVELRKELVKMTEEIEDTMIIREEDILYLLDPRKAIRDLL